MIKRGMLYSESLTDEKSDAATYIDMVRHNIKALSHALTPRAGASLPAVRRKIPSSELLCQN